MRIAISTDNGMVSAHFGRCPVFTIVEIENGNILKKEQIDNPGHQPGLIPRFLHEKGINCIVAGGMGMRAKDFFEKFGIETITGISGNVDDVIHELINGTVKGTDSLCMPGEGKGYGLDKQICDHGYNHGC